MTSAISVRRSGGLAILALAGLVLAGCEERLSDEVVFPRGKAERQRVAPPAPTAARYQGAYMLDRYRSNCALSRC